MHITSVHTIETRTIASRVIKGKTANGSNYHHTVTNWNPNAQSKILLIISTNEIVCTTLLFSDCFPIEKVHFRKSMLLMRLSLHQLDLTIKWWHVSESEKKFDIVYTNMTLKNLQKIIGTSKTLMMLQCVDSQPYRISCDHNTVTSHERHGVSSHRR